MKRLPTLTTWIAASILAYSSPPHAFNPTHWKEDFAQLREALAVGYANLDWMVTERRIDLKALVARTDRELQEAETDEQAARAIKRFLDEFKDGHLRIAPPRKESAPPTATGAPQSCADLGYRIQRKDGIEFRGLTPVGEADDRIVPAGVFEAEGKRVGVIRISLFFEHAFPELCQRHMPKPAPCDTACRQKLFGQVGKDLTRTLHAQVTALAKAKIDALVFDITGNGGGSNWAEAAARVVTGPGLKAPVVAFIKHPHWVKSLDYRLSDIERDLKRPELDEPRRAWLTKARERIQAVRTEAAAPCDRSGVWEGRAGCSLLITGRLHTLGLEALPEPLAFDGFAAEWVHNNLVSYQATSAWQGPLAVLVDGGTGSAAELFAATLKDNGRATIIGAHTVGSGCGYTNGGIPLTLKHSGVEVKFPDCVRLRADGSNEVAGIAPDVKVGEGRRLDAREVQGAVRRWVLGL